MACAKWALASSSSASRSPRSANPLPLLGVTVASSRRADRRVLDAVLGMAILLLLLERSVVVPSEPVPASYDLDVVSWSRDPPLRLLLEDVEHVDHSGQIHSVDRAIRPAVVILDELQHAGTTKALERLRCLRRPPELHAPQRSAKE